MNIKVAYKSACFDFFAVRKRNNSGRLCKMTDEAPVSFSGKKRKAATSQTFKQGERICIIHFKDVREEKIIPLKNRTKAQLVKYYKLHVQGRVTEGFSHIVSRQS